MQTGESKSACCLLHACLLFDFFVDPGEGGYMIFRNISWLPTDYTLLHLRVFDSSSFNEDHWKFLAARYFTRNYFKILPLGDKIFYNYLCEKPKILIKTWSLNKYHFVVTTFSWMKGDRHDFHIFVFMCRSQWSRSVFAHFNDRILGSNPTRGMCACKFLLLFCCIVNIVPCDQPITRQRSPTNCL